MSSTTLHLRDEALPIGWICPITPETAKVLIDAGYTVNIEHSTVRPYSDSAYTAVGCTIVAQNSWPTTPKSHIIISGKLLDNSNIPLNHVHVHAAHIFKRQKGWQATLSRYRRGGGTLLAVDSLKDSNGLKLSRVERGAGFAGTALAIKAWAWQLAHPNGPPLPGTSPYHDSKVLFQEVLAALSTGKAVNNNQLPSILVTGARGRCGRGAIAFLHSIGIPDSHITQWNRGETARGGPFEEIMHHDILLNCIYNATPIQPFITHESIKAAGPNRTLSVVGDITCDIHTPNNAIPIYTYETTFAEPTIQIPVEQGRSLAVVGMICFPALLTREASDATSRALLPSFLKLNNWREEREWVEVEQLFKDALKMLEEEEEEAERVARRRKERDGEFGRLVRASL